LEIRGNIGMIPMIRNQKMSAPEREQETSRSRTFNDFPSSGEQWIKEGKYAMKMTRPGCHYWSIAYRRTVKPTIRTLWRNLWPIIIDLWVASVLLLFITIRVIGSNTGKHLLQALGIH
jgi:hypothetical protein